MTGSNIATAINAAHDLVEQSKREGVRHAIDCGRLLTAAKATAPHGKWNNWVAENCRFSMRTAQLYMRVFDHVGDDAAKAQRVAHLSLRGIAAELVVHAPSTSAKTDDQVIDPLVRWYGAEGAVKIKFAMELLDQAQIDEPTAKKMLAQAGVDPDTAATRAAEMLAAHVPVRKAKRVVSLLKDLARHGGTGADIVREMTKLRPAA